MAATALAQGLVPLPANDATAAAKREFQTSAAGLWRPLTGQQDNSAALVAGQPTASPSFCCDITTKWHWVRKRTDCGIESRFDSFAAVLCDER